jgi:O-antigen ligase
VPQTASERKPELVGQAAEMLSALLIAAAFAVIQALVGGTRLLFSMPAYGLVAMAGMLTVFSLRRGKPPPNQLCLWASTLFFGYIVTRALLSPVPYLARTDIYSVLAGVILYLTVACILTSAPVRMWILMSLLAAAMAHVLVGVIQFRHGDNFMPISFLERFDYGHRASGFYVCPNHLAGLLEVVGIMGLSIVCWSRWPAWTKLLTAYAVGVCYLGQILTGSRGGYLSAGASLLTFALLSLMILRQVGSRPFWRIGGVSLLAMAVMGITAVYFVQKSDYLSERAKNIFDDKNMRLDLWHAALQQWKLRPWLGTGSGTYLFYGRQFRTDQMQLDPVQVHNDYLHLLAEYGLVGGVLFLAFLGSHLWNGWKSFERLGPKRVAISSRLASNSMALQIGAIAAVAAYVIHSVVDFNLHIPANVLLLAFVFGILANAGARHGPDPLPPGQSQIAWRLVAPTLAIIATIQCVRLLPGEYFTERARLAWQDDKHAEAVRWARRALESEKNNPDLYDYLGRARADLADSILDRQERDSLYQAALAAFESGRALAPQDKTFALDLAFAFDALGRFAEAEWMFSEAFSLDPKSTSTRDYYEAHLTRWREWKPEPSP